MLLLSVESLITKVYLNIGPDYFILSSYFYLLYIYIDDTVQLGWKYVAL